MFRNYFLTAFRNLNRNKLFSAINLSGLALGLACVMLILLFIKDELSYDRFHANVKRIYRVTTINSNEKTGKVNQDGNTGFFQGPKFTQNVPGIRQFVRVRSGAEDIKTGTEIHSQSLLRVDSSFFSVFSFPLVSGDAKTCLLKPQSVVISEDLAKKQFGNKEALGKTVMIKEGNGFVPFEVTAVAKNCPQNSSIKFEMLMPFQMSKEEAANQENWFNFFLNTFVVLDNSANQKAVEAGMQRFYDIDSRESMRILSEKFGEVFAFKTQYKLQPYTDMHLNRDLPAQNGLSDASNPIYSYILSGIAIFILLIACINFINLTLARSVKRAREIGIRKVVGGERSQLISQFMSESFLFCFLSFLMAIVLVEISLPVFNQLANKSLSLSYLLDEQLIAGFFLLFLVTGFLAGAYPALILSSYQPAQTLYNRFYLAGKNYLQKGLVILQFALASFLIIGTFTLHAQFDFLTHEKLGYDDKNLVLVNKDRLTGSEIERLRTELLSNPAIVRVAPKNQGDWGTTAKVNGDSSVNFNYETIDHAFLPTLDIPLVAGRNFSTDFPSDSLKSVLVNEAFVKAAGWKYPLGELVNFWYNENEKYVVIGVVKDYHFQALNEKIRPQLFTMKPDNGYGTCYIRIKPGSETAALKHIEKTFRKLFPLNPYQYVFKNDENRNQYESEAKWKQIMLFSAAITIFISCIGLFGLSVLSAEKRTKEIGIRKVLGASVGSITTALCKDFVVLVLVSLVIAMPLAWVASNNWLQNYSYRISVGWEIFVGSSILVVGIALVTISFQAVKSALANPIKSLRTE